MLCLSRYRASPQHRAARHGRRGNAGIKPAEYGGAVLGRRAWGWRPRPMAPRPRVLCRRLGSLLDGPAQDASDSSRPSQARILARQQPKRAGCISWPRGRSFATPHRAGVKAVPLVIGPVLRGGVDGHGAHHPHGDGRARQGRLEPDGSHSTMTLGSSSPLIRNHGRRGNCEAPSGDARITDHSTNQCRRTASLEAQHRADILGCLIEAISGINIYVIDLDQGNH